MTIRACTALALVVAMTLPASAAQPQQPQAPEATASLRVTTADAVVRIAATDDASIVASPGLASILEVARTEGDWHVVLLPADAQGLRRYGYIHRRHAELVERGVVPDAPKKPALTIPDVAAVGLAPDWQARFRAAEARRSSGKAKVVAGIVTLAAGGALLAVVATKMSNSRGATGECSDLNPCYEYLWGTVGGVGLLVTGGMVISRGRRQVGEANAEVLKLKTELANANTGGKGR
jgi:hypothetical protein